MFPASRSCTSSWALFHLFVWFNFDALFLFYFVTLHYIMLYFILIPQKLVCLLMRDNNGEDLDGRGREEELGGVERGETEIRICHVRKRNLLSVKGKNPYCKCSFLSTWFLSPALYPLDSSLLLHRSWP